MRTFSALLLAACSATAPDTDPPAEGIEITGYLDASRIGLTLLDPLDGPARAQVVGRPGATDAPEISVATELDEVVVPTSVDGSFAARIDVTEGDAIVVALPDGSAEPVSLVVEEQEPFPALAHHVVHGPDAAGLVVLDLTFTAPLPPDLELVLSSDASHEVVVMTRSSDTDATGTIHASSGDHLVVHGEHPVDGATAGVELGVP